MRQKAGFAALLAVIGISIVFGMVVGGKLNAPPVVRASKEPGYFPAATGGSAAIPGQIDFSAIAEGAIPAVVGVSNTAVNRARGGDETPEEDAPEENPNEEFFRWFFGPDDPHRQMPRRQPPQRRQSSGSGFIVSKDGYILTNHHVVDKATKLVVTLNDGDKFDAEVVGSDPNIDMALIKIDPKSKILPTLPLGNSDDIKIGQWVCAIGNPLEFDSTFTVGVVSGKRRRVQIGDTLPGLANFIQTDAAINFGNSGGPLLDAAGRVVGINTASFRGYMAEGIGFAIPINEARKAAEQIRESGSVQRGYLGITMNATAINDSAREYYGLPDASGVLVTGFSEKSPAAKAGLKKGDIIRKVDGDAIKDNADLIGKVASRRPGETLQLEVRRGKETLQVPVTLTVRPSAEELARQIGDEGEPPGGDADEPVKPSRDLGIRVEPLTQRQRARLGLEDDVRGLVITAVDPESQAADEGLIPGMLVVGVNDSPVETLSDWNGALGKVKPGAVAKVEIMQGQRNAVVFLRVAEKKP